MMKKMSLNYGILSIFCYIRMVYSVVPEYCTQPFNRDDCGMKPVPVFKYWKPGSRCEVDYWRGCPTANKFQDVYNCTLTCIFKMSNFIEDTKSQCQISLNKNICTEEPKLVYTYENGVCVSRMWGGCPSVNIFQTEDECNKACGDDDWTAKLQNLSIEQLKDIDNILSNLTDASSIETSSSLESSNSNDDKSKSADSKSVNSNSRSDDSVEKDGGGNSSRESDQNKDSTTSKEDSTETTTDATETNSVEKDGGGNSSAGSSQNNDGTTNKEDTTETNKEDTTETATDAIENTDTTVDIPEQIGVVSLGRRVLK